MKGCCPSGWLLVSLASVLVAAMATSAQPQGQALETPFSQCQQALESREEQFSFLPETRAITRRVQDVFHRIMQVSGRRPGAVLEIYVLDTPKILVEAFPAGCITISRGAVELTREDDNALAFLLAHEVAHQVRDHHALLNTSQQLLLQAPSPGSQSSPSISQEALHQTLELEADRLGVLFSALAGYRAKAALSILPQVINRQGPSPFHPNPRRRAKWIQEVIGEIAAQIQLFHLGVFYLTTGRYEAAAKTFESFQSEFPSREVYNNLGVAYHKRALQYQVDDGLRRSIMIDPETRAEAAVRAPGAPEERPGGLPHPIFREAMDKALEAYLRAVESDPGYALSHVNLGATYLDRGEYDAAIVEFKRALEKEPTLKAAYLNRGVAYLKSGNLHRAEADFRQVASLDPSDPAPHMNLRYLYRKQGRQEVAQQEAEITRQLEARQRAEVRAGEGQREALGPIAIDMPVDQARQGLGGVPTRTLGARLGLGEEVRVLIYEPKGLLLVSRQDRIEAARAGAEYRGKTARGVAIRSSANQVMARYGRPSKEEETLGGGLWVYPDRGLVLVLRDGQVRAWWVY